MNFVAKILYVRILSQSGSFATTRVNWFSSNPLVTIETLKDSDEVFETENQFSWKVEYFSKDNKN